MNVEFEADKYDYKTFEKKVSPILGMVIKMGLADNEKGANYILIGATILFIALAVIIFIS